VKEFRCKQTILSVVSTKQEERYRRGCGWMIMRAVSGRIILLGSKVKKFTIGFQLFKYYLHFLPKSIG
jgi:hypothetical protein